jgi:hypothetical protein
MAHRAGYCGYPFGTSPGFVDYRIKRLGLWRDHIGKKVALLRPIIDLDELQVGTAPPNLFENFPNFRIRYDT